MARRKTPPVGVTSDPDVPDAPSASSAPSMPSALPSFGDKVTYHDPESGRFEDAVVLGANDDGTVALAFKDGNHVVITFAAVPDAGRFGGYRPA